LGYDVKKKRKKIKKKRPRENKARFFVSYS